MKLVLLNIFYVIRLENAFSYVLLLVIIGPFSCKTEIISLHGMRHAVHIQ